eukprot:784764-Rhodomonas_salina.1
MIHPQVTSLDAPMPPRSSRLSPGQARTRNSFTIIECSGPIGIPIPGVLRYTGTRPGGTRVHRGTRVGRASY